SVCFNNCNGHGHCVDYSCQCFVGYLGDACDTTFAEEGDIVPILTAGHFNITRKNFTQTVSQHKLMIVGFSSYSCYKCISVEPAYRNLSLALTQRNIPFARGDADRMKSIAAEVGAVDLPALVLFQKMRPIVYRGVHSVEAVLTYVDKQLGKAAVPLHSVEEVTAFLDSRKDKNRYGVATAMTVGFFGEMDVEEDDYEEFVEAAKELQLNEDLYFGLSVNLDELYGENAGIKSWVLKNSLPLVGKMTGTNFLLYEKQRLPILMLFLDLTDEHAIAEGETFVGGRSGGVFNEELLGEFRLAAQEHVGRILFVYLDGVQHQDQMKSLGLYGGQERLPSIAFNTRDGSQVPFPEELPVNRDTLLQFCADFVSGKLRSIEDTKEMAKKALTSALPVNPKNLATRREKKKAPAETVGVSEQFGDGQRGDGAVVVVTMANFDEVVMDDKDVVLMLHAENSEACAHFAVYYKRMALRFGELGLPSLTIARMDVSQESPPASLNLMQGALPIMVMVPAMDKGPPFTFFSGVSKVQQMMKWVQQQASIPIELGNLPHLSDLDKERYKEQVREREVALDKKRTED
ncbi:hypothetical protein B484DRAFT_313858, partial [Ochromonadaceae sp. CCMP2298]